MLPLSFNYKAVEPVYKNKKGRVFTLCLFVGLLSRILAERCYTELNASV